MRHYHNSRPEEKQRAEGKGTDSLASLWRKMRAREEAEKSTLFPQLAHYARTRCFVEGLRSGAPWGGDMTESGER